MTDLEQPHPHPHPHATDQPDPSTPTSAPTSDPASWGAADWDARYASREHASAPGRLWSGAPNATLVAEAEGLAPGRALDVGCGEGADALWLARRGWQVTGLDLSRVALARAAAAAAADPRVAGRTTWHRVDVGDWSPATASADLVTAHFLHEAPARRATTFRHLASAVAPGGTLLVVGHSPADVTTGLRSVEHAELLFGPDDVVAALDPASWTIEVATERPRPERSHERSGPGSRTGTAHDTVVRARRRP
ncbi:class I SAM-dependent methyltransferase [Frigoribacterium salinisoli]